jgi:hypothetical protein
MEKQFLQLFKTVNGRNNFLKLILKIILALFLVQLLRGNNVLFVVVGGPRRLITIFQLINGLALL